MSEAVLFIDRDGTLIEEPPDEQVDRLHKLRFMPGVFAALAALRDRGFRFVMVTNQDGLGTATYPQSAFEEVQEFLLDAFSSQNIFFDAVFVCPHRQRDDCVCRKPKTGLVEDFLREHDIDRARSAVIGDRATDLVFAASLKVRGLTVHREGPPEATWSHVAGTLLARTAQVARETAETRVAVRVNLDAPAPLSITTGIAFFDHMLEQLARHGGFSVELGCRGDLDVDEHHTVEDCALTLGDALRQALGSKHGVTRYGFVLPMDESEANVALDLSGRPYAEFSGQFLRETVGGLPTELVSHFFRSFADGLRATLHVRVQGENAHHMIEACFKGVGRALRAAIHREGADLPTTKGIL